MCKISNLISNHDSHQTLLSEPSIKYVKGSDLLTKQYQIYRGADKSLSLPWKEKKLQRPRLTTLYQDLWRTNNRNIFLLSWYSVVSLGRCSLFPSRVGLRTYQHPGNKSLNKIISTPGNKSLNKTDLPRKMPLPLLMVLVAEAHLSGQSRRLTSAWNKLKSLMMMMLLLMMMMIIIIIIGHLSILLSLPFVVSVDILQKKVACYGEVSQFGEMYYFIQGDAALCA